MGGNDLFSDQELKKMMVPLFLEQLLVMLVGLADTLVISYAGESAVSGALSNGLRAAGDVKFTMYVSVVSTVAVRLFLSYLLGITLRMGVIGIALAMYVTGWSGLFCLFGGKEPEGGKLFR